MGFQMDACNRTFTITYDHSGSVEHAAPRHACIALRRYAAEPPLCRACCSAARPHHFAGAMPTKLRSAERVRSAASPHHFAVVTPTKPRRAERFRPAAPRITLRLLHLRNSAVLSAFVPRHPASLCGYYAYETPPC